MLTTLSLFTKIGGDDHVSATKKPRYECKITLGKGINGELLRKSFYSTKSKSDAKRKAEKFKAQYELDLLCGGEPLHPKSLFKDWAPVCLERYKKPFVKGNTYTQTYLTPVNKHLIPHFGKLALDEIRPIQIQEFVNQESKKYAPETVKKDFAALSFIMQHAAENGLCKSNPAFSSIRLPKVQRADKHTYTQEEYDKVYAFAKGHPNGLALMLLLETGISRSELLGLRWEDIDFKESILHIRQGLVAYQNLEENSWVVEADGLKNSYRRRDVPIVDAALIERLKCKPRSIEVTRRKGQAPELVEAEFVFHSPQGQAYQPNNWNNRVFLPFMRDLHTAHPELPMLTAHELRHTRATLWLAQGVSPLMVAKLLGHSDLKMLAKVYDHTTVDTLRKAITKT